MRAKRLCSLFVCWCTAGAGVIEKGGGGKTGKVVDPAIVVSPEPP